MAAAELTSQKKEEMAVVDDYGDSSDTAAANTTESKEMESVSEFRKKKAIKGTSLFMNKRRRRLIQIIDLMRFIFRRLFGLTFANKWGFYVDHYMSKQIFDYQDWIDYPKRDHILKEKGSKAYSAVMSNDGYDLYTGLCFGSIIAWNLTNLSKIYRWDAHRRAVYSLVYRAGLLVSGGGDRLIRVWNARSFKLIRTLQGHRDDVLRIVFNKKGDRLISASADRSILIWSVKSGKYLKMLIGHKQRVSSMIFAADNMIISGSFDGSLKVWDERNYEELRSVTEGMYQAAYGLAMNSDKSLLCCVWYKKLIVYSWPELRVRHTIDIDAYCCTFHPLLPNIVAIADRPNEYINLYDICKEEIIHHFEGHTEQIVSICFSPDGYRMVSAAMQQTVRIWDVEFLLDQ